MPQINILNILQGDNQNTIVDKINYNFDQILSAGGGPQGQQGLIGPTGPIGPQGVQGPQGLQGATGTKWFVQDSAPAKGSIGGFNPWLYPTLGDYWIDPDSIEQDIYVFNTTGWTYTGYGLAAGDIFQKISPVNFSGSLTGSAVLFSGTAGPQTLVLSDSDIYGITGYTPSGNAIDNINYENAKLKIASRNDRTNLISFSHSDFDTTNTSGLNPATGNYTWNPSIQWESASPATNTFYDIAFQNPTGSISIRSLGTINGGVNLFANLEASVQSSSENIILKTSSINKGTFIDSSTNGGFLEMSNNVSVPVNQLNAPLFANSVGLGLGLGTGQFKQTGLDSRRLAVKGNVSISKDNSDHLISLYTGNSSFPLTYDKGTLYTEGFGAFGHTNPTGDPIGGGTTKGANESSGVLPKFWITSPYHGAGLQVRTSAKSKGDYSRTLIGDGRLDWSAAGDNLNYNIGYGPNFSQEYSFSGGKGVGVSGGPLLSITQRISDPSIGNFYETPVFGITTFVNSQGSYDNSTVAKETLISTYNSNKTLRINPIPNDWANSSLTLGVNDKTSLKFWPNAQYNTNYGSITVGKEADTNSGYRAPLYSSNVVSNVGNNTEYYSTDNHSLYITGFQTIGAKTPASLFSTYYYPDTFDYVGADSVLKIHRNLATSSVGNNGVGWTASGPYPNNYPNGLEITSFKSTGAGAANANKSVAIAVGASSQVKAKGGGKPVANPTGFYVSDTGENVAIGTQINQSYALNVSGPTNIVGTTTITGSLTVSGGISGALPIGIINPFAGNGLPAGWLECDGSQVSRTTYNLLFAAIGTNWGYGDNSTTFNLPDLRGMFLRGVDGTAGNDPDKATRTANNPGGNTGNAVGSEQVDEFKTHRHGYDRPNEQVSNNPDSGGGVYLTRTVAQSTVTGFTGGNETRPKNVYVKYIIYTGV